MRFIPLKDGSGKYKDTQTGQIGYITRGKGGGWYLADTPNRTSLREFRRQTSIGDRLEKTNNLTSKRQREIQTNKAIIKDVSLSQGVYKTNNQDEKNKTNSTAYIEGGANTRVKRNWNRYSEEQRREEREKVLRQKIQDYKNKKANIVDKEYIKKVNDAKNDEELAKADKYYKDNTGKNWNDGLEERLKEGTPLKDMTNNSINDIKVEAEDRKEFAENVINKIEAEKVARIQKRAKTEKQKEFEMADNQMKAKIEKFKERKGKVADNGIKLYTVRKNEQGTYIEDLINKYNKMVSENKGDYKTLQSLRKEIAERRKGK